MAEEKSKPQDPDNVFVSPAKNDPEGVSVFVPVTYRDAQSALKEVGAKFSFPSSWVLPKATFEASEGKIREAARQDIALGSEGRGAREKTLKEAKEAEKAANAPTPEELEARKQARGEKANADAKARDKDRVPVQVGAVKAGDEIVTDNGTRIVSHMGTNEFAVNEQLIERFPELHLTLGEQVVFANFPPLEKEAKPDSGEEPANP